MLTSAIILFIAGIALTTLTSIATEHGGTGISIATGFLAVASMLGAFYCLSAAGIQ